MKTYMELVNEVKEEMANGGKRTFNKELFSELSRAYLNDYSATTQVAKTKNGEMFTEEITPVDDFRKFIERVLIDFGVDKQEATKIRDNYEFTNADALYPICSELITNYLDTGKRFFHKRLTSIYLLFISSVYCFSYCFFHNLFKFRSKDMFRYIHNLFNLWCFYILWNYMHTSTIY